MALREISTGLPVSLSPSPPPLYYLTPLVTPSFPKLLAGSLPTPLAMPSLPAWPRPPPLADPMPSLALLCPPVTTLANSELSYRVNGGKAGLSLLQPIPSAEVRSRPCNGPSYLVRAGRTPSPLTWLPDFPVSDTTIPFLCLGTLITPAINLSFLELFLLLSPTHQAQEQSSAFSSPN